MIPSYVISKKEMDDIARDELRLWDRSGKIPQGLAMAIIFAYIHRIQTGQTVEEGFFGEPSPVIDFQI